MLTKNQQAWVDALRSGEFEQGRDCLQDGEGYCCLGVLCKVAEREGVPVYKSLDGAIYGLNLSDQKPVMKWAGLPSITGALTIPNNIETCLSVLNDRGGTFAEIADIIEQNADSLFVKVETNV